MPVETRRTREAARAWRGARRDAPVAGQAHPGRPEPGDGRDALRAGRGGLHLPFALALHAGRARGGEAPAALPARSRRVGTARGLAVRAGQAVAQRRLSGSLAGAAAPRLRHGPRPRSRAGAPPSRANRVPARPGSLMATAARRPTSGGTATRHSSGDGTAARLDAGPAAGVAQEPAHAGPAWPHTRA